MRHWILALLALSCFPFQFANATPQGFDIDVYAESGRLKQLNYSEFTTPVANRELERDRRGARLSWGTTANQGFLKIFNETTDITEESRTEMVGVGFGSYGTLTFNENEAETGMVVPWQIDLAYSRGDITEGPAHGSAYYLELYGDIGIGVRANNFQATIGATTSGTYGYLQYDSVFENESIDGTNGGSYIDLQYKRVGSPLYSQLRWSYGDYESLLVRIGLRF